MYELIAGNNQNNYASDILSIREAVDKLLQNPHYLPHLQPMQEEDEEGEVDVEGEDEDLEEEETYNQYESIALNGLNQRVTVTVLSLKKLSFCKILTINFTSMLFIYFF